MKRFFILYFATVGFILFIFILIHKTSYIGEKIELRYHKNYSLTYPEALEAYKYLDKKYKTAKLIEYGPTDFGLPLHLFVISKHGIFNPTQLHRKGFRVLMVNNGIHPGEPCGIDASIQLAYDILEQKDQLWNLLDSTVICFVPVYNIGGAFNRSAYNRANQNGPQEQGFRANAKNLDLNRDFAPMDSRNAQSFAQIFHLWKPHLLIDTHATNGADYQYVMTVIEPHPQGLPPMLGNFYATTMEPFLYSNMEKVGYPMTPYVDPMDETPESGIEQYISTPRYTTGYGRMFNTLTFFTEAHMFKPFHERVLATYHFIKISLEFINLHGSLLALNMNLANEFVKTKEEYVLLWELDSARVESFNFMGYEAEHIVSKITGFKRLKYNREKPFTKPIPYFRHYKPTLSIKKPQFYIIPQAWHEVIYRLSLNGVAMQRLTRDTSLMVESYYIDSYKTLERPYNGHYLQHSVKVQTKQQKVTFYKGDYLVTTNQSCNEYIVQMLEPEAYDSFFAWNFFDPILQRKEYFSPYVFEDYAEKMLAEDPELKNEFEMRKKTDTQFASNAYAQLNFLYQRSPYFEVGFMRYPIFRYNP